MDWKKRQAVQAAYIGAACTAELMSCDSELEETLNKSMFDDQPVKPLDAGHSKISGLPQSIQLKKFMVLFTQLLLSASVQGTHRHDACARARNHGCDRHDPTENSR